MKFQINKSIAKIIYNCEKLKCGLSLLSTPPPKNKLVAGSLEAAYSLNWGARQIWGKGGARPWHFYDK